MPRPFIVVLFLLISHVTIAQSKVSHQVVKGETLYSIAKKYHVTVGAIQKANKSIGEDLKLKIGQILVIPSSAPVVAETKPSKQEAVSESPREATTHVVIKGETAYGIAKALGITVKELQEANHLSDNMTLKLGQKLIIPVKNKEAIYKPAVKESQPEAKAMPQPEVIKTESKKPENTEPAKTVEQKIPVEPVKAEQPIEKVKEENKVPPSQPQAKTSNDQVMKNENLAPNDYDVAFAKEAESGKKKVTYRGIAMFMQSENPGNQFLALYNYAEMGSILKVTNLMSKVTIYVKVIGKVPTGDAQGDVILKVSAEAAAKLKVSEDKFLVEVTGYNNP